MTSHSVKAFVLKATAAAALAGAVLVAAPTKAQAQQFAVGVQFGAPAYGPAYGYENDHRRWEREQAAIAREQAWQQHEAWEQHERWERREASRDWNRRDWDRHQDWDRHRDDDGDRRDSYAPRAYNGWR